MRAALIRLSCLLSMLIAGPSANAIGIYWTTDTCCPSHSSNTIGRANLDGTNVNGSLITSDRAVTGLGVGENYMYWSTYDFNRISRANLDGTGVSANFIGSASPAGIALDETYLYVSNSGFIGRAKLDGTDYRGDFIRFIDTPTGLAVDKNYIYWTYYAGCGPAFSCGKIGRANLDGTQANSNFITTGVNGAIGIAVDSNYLYWADSGLGTIARANLDGTGVNQNFISGISPYGIAIDGTHIYWADNYSNAIGRASLDGTGVDESFITGASAATYGFPIWIAVVVPEPGTGLLVIAGLLGLAGWRRARD